ncbi:type VII secretion protein EccE [Mycolicibacterium sphagni]|uniref:type VII secretion protein EccE n=1 Tax=Mycolicibacterium sphagni TaxID=1786 RepID=UPI0021F37A5E|nr:type VII secretion protein EccE [Mycolicibacterium sphagni]MCV7174611.1 type VII secretion protein EccE [Mycolicibacterium sphagni]
MRIVWPGSGRVALALVVVVPAVMAYPWHTQTQRWALGVAAAVVLALFGWWRGLHLTTILWRRLVLATRTRRREHGALQPVEHSGTDARTTMVLRVMAAGAEELPVDLITGYLDRYGVRCETVRLTTRDTPAGRTMWIGLTMSARANLTALQARSTTIPLRETADLTARRFADELREHGWAVTSADLNIPDMLGPHVTEHWRAVADGQSGYLAAYGVDGDSAPDSLAALRSHGFDELWTAAEVSRGGIAMACAIRTPDLPDAGAPVEGLVLRRGGQWAALHALIPTSTKALDAEVSEVDSHSVLRWMVNGAAVRS